MTRISVRWGGSELAGPLIRSEEHTSELQSQSNLVCRLLLEKKKTSRTPTARARPSAPRLTYPDPPPRVRDLSSRPAHAPPRCETDRLRRAPHQRCTPPAPAD